MGILRINRYINATSHWLWSSGGKSKVKQTPVLIELFSGSRESNLGVIKWKDRTACDCSFPCTGGGWNLAADSDGEWQGACFGLGSRERLLWRTFEQRFDWRDEGRVWMGQAGKGSSDRWTIQIEKKCGTVVEKLFSVVQLLMLKYQLCALTRFHCQLDTT